MWMVVSYYVGNDEFFDRMLITILFENLRWYKAMTHVLGFANSPNIDDKALNTWVYAVLVTID